MTSDGEVGMLLQAVVNRISHRGGTALALMNDAGVTLHQVLLITRVREAGKLTVSELAGQFGMTPSALSQSADKLVKAGYLSRAEDDTDRRRKHLALTVSGRELLARLIEVRSAEYAAGLAKLSPDLKQRLEAVLRDVLQLLDEAH